MIQEIVETTQVANDVFPQAFVCPMQVHYINFEPCDLQKIHNYHK